MTARSRAAHCVARAGAARGLIALCATAAALAACNEVVTTLPPPSASLSSAPCSPAQGCPADGVVVIVRGRARAGALVLGENITRPQDEGRAYVGSATAVVERDADGGDAAASTAGQYEIVLGPLDREGGQTPHVSRRGDRVRVWQYITTSTRVEGSQPAERELVVP